MQFNSLMCISHLPLPAKKKKAKQCLVMFVFEVKGLNTCKVLGILSEKSCLLKIFYQIILFCLH